MQQNAGEYVVIWTGDMGENGKSLSCPNARAKLDIFLPVQVNKYEGKISIFQSLSV